MMAAAPEPAVGGVRSPIPGAPLGDRVRGDVDMQLRVAYRPLTCYRWLHIEIDGERRA